MNNDEKKGLAFSVLFHIVCCALVGLLVLTNFHTFPEEPVYDVALVGGGDAAPEVAQPEPEPEPEPEEIIKPKEDDIVEKKEKPVPRSKRRKSLPRSRNIRRRVVPGPAPSRELTLEKATVSGRPVMQSRLRLYRHG